MLLLLTNRLLVDASAGTPWNSPAAPLKRRMFFESELIENIKEAESDDFTVRLGFFSLMHHLESCSSPVACLNGDAPPLSQ
ncbi:hypothetical protein [Halobacillus litoralis]|uniref:Uncharacterized protein n=1 Tax=Halobacillus litoralis TaxID=45668 RepID=A0A410MI54_9BACI|nr:hypothetical protein [Halobacillus litoralis]QAS54427.1 hypothetical protein HLI_20495 [Halobacillus litoralis]